MKTAEDYLEASHLTYIDHEGDRMIAHITVSKDVEFVMNEFAKDKLEYLRSLALQLDRKGVKSLIEEIDKMINEL